jgi:hypothetical protein
MTLRISSMTGTVVAVGVKVEITKGPVIRPAWKVLEIPYVYPFSALMRCMSRQANPPPPKM